MRDSLPGDVNPKSLRMKVHNPFLAIPSSSETPPSNVFTEVTTTVRSIYGNPLPKKKIFVTDYSVGFGKLKEVIIFASNHEDRIEPILYNGYEGFFIETNEHGEISFFIHPKISPMVSLQLYAQIPGDDNIFAADYIIYIVDHTYQELPSRLLEPKIIGCSGGNIKSNGHSRFEAQISNVDDVEDAESILFFVNGEYTKESIPFEYASDFTLPYSIFKSNSLSEFSYIVIRRSGDIYPYKSRVLELNYMREPNKPWSDVNRVYDSCKVYNSKGVKSGNIIEQYTFISEEDISYSNSDNAGVYVVITGTNVPGDTSKVAFGSEVTLNLYTNSLSGDFRWSCNKIMPFLPDEYDGNTATLIFPIPLRLLNNNPAFPSGKYGEVYFDYQIGVDIDPDVSYGRTWFGHINTFD
ncbi:hypothetical protein [Xenorhabdus sp. KK7.4]|uniref:hypothetical protein n=1 Tax=Xenorhabdus sp. KK7.4 TaxID=1851572 RepID=UPI000C04D2B3|nr:hypothetical protein [Xenorhabdus sp. KK7.4]PHM59232.1 hypothetical protein Xekk_00531 [Xenorhabdus sp. KK7.4]